MLIFCLTALAADTVTIEVDGAASVVEAQVIWLGEERWVPLSDPDGDGVQTVTLTGDELRLLPLSLWSGGVESWRGTVPVGMGEQTLSFTTIRTEPPTLQQAAVADTPDNIARREAGLLVGWFAWMLVVLVGLAAFFRRPTPAAPDRWRWWWSLPIWAGLSVLWTWPAVTAGGGAMVGRHFDILGTIWAMDAASRLLENGLVDPLTLWPMGRDAQRFDSFTLLPIGALLADVGLDRIHGALQLAGVFLLGISGEAFARSVGARGWWGLLGGATLALSGLSTNVLLEGHVYHLLNPWLPLLGLTWWRACSTESRWIWGALSGVLFGLCLLTTAYVGMAAAVVVVGFALPALPRRQTWPALATAALTAALFAVPYTLLFVAGDTGSRGYGDIQSTLDLAALAPITPEGLRSDFGRTLAPAAALPALLLAAFVLRCRGRWALMLTGLMAIALAAGLVPEAIVPPALLRFPVRLGWASLLTFGALAALGGTALQARVGRRARILVVLALVEPFVLGWPGRAQQRQLSLSPTAYHQADGPFIDLLPEDTDRAAPLGTTGSRLICFYQTHHREPIAEDCFEAPVREGLQIAPWLYSSLLAGNTTAVQQALSSLGFAGIVLHPDLFSSADRSWLLQRLTQLDPQPAVSTDGGEHVMIFRIPPAEKPSTDLSFASVHATDIQTLGDPSDTGPAALQARIELLVPSDYEGNGFYVELTDETGRHRTAELSDEGLHAQDLPGDSLWVGLLHGPLPRQGTLTIHVRGPQFSEEAWEGTVFTSAPITTLAFRLSVKQNQVVPMLVTSPTSSSPPITPHNDAVIALGWLLWLLAAAGVGWRLSSSPGADPAA